jgi:hypothetical protein
MTRSRKPGYGNSELPLASMENLLKELRKSSDDFGRSLSSSFSKGVVEGKRFELVLKDLRKSLSENLLKTALKPLELTLSSQFENVFKNVFRGLNLLPNAAENPPTFARGAAFGGGRVRPFASGGVIATPSYFPMAGGSLGLMGERGPEAIMPLTRGADGKLGVRSEGGGRPVSITLNVTTPDADSFRRSETQISAAIARAAARGRRAL